MDYHAAFIKLYGAAGAALEELVRLGDGVRVPEILEARRILMDGITAAEERMYSDSKDVAQ